ncbi:MAG: DNA repair exonuclease [Dethiobacteria bacterium]
MLRFLHLADLHLGWEPSYLPEDKRKIRRRERDRLLEKAVDFALSPQNRIQAVLIVGDLFEHYSPEGALVTQAMDQLARLNQAGMMVVTIPGNHDEITYRNSVYREHGENWPGFLVRNPMPELSIAHEIGGTMVHIYSLAYTGGITRPGSIKSFPRSDASGLHIGAFHGSLDWEGLADRSLPLDSSLLAAAGYDYIALGHYHTYMEKRVGTGKAVYPGAAEFKSFSDPGSGFQVVVEYNGKEAKTENVPMAVRKHRYEEINLSTLADPEELRQACLKFAGEEVMIHLTFSGTPRFSINAGALTGELESHFFHLEIVNDARYFAEDFLNSIADEPTVRGMYVRRIREKQGRASTEREQKVLQQALLKGLAALEGGDQA